MTAPWASLYETEEPASIALRGWWLLPILALAAYWPWLPYWQSDDFLALDYAQDLQRALQDFTGSQYGLTGVAWFYRPFITLSFALEQWFGPPSPFVAHLVNAIPHAISALLIARITRRFASNSAAWFTGLIWALAPSHPGSVLWTVGRVDSHTTLWIALACLFLLRALEGRGRGAALLGWTAFVLALGSKESAIALPGIATVLAFAQGGRAAGSHDVPKLSQRLGAALRTVWPLLLILAGYFGLRRIALGRFLGGYDSAPPIDPLQQVEGLGVYLTQLVNPLTHSGQGWIENWLQIDLPRTAVLGVGYLPIALAILLLLRRRRFGLLASALVLFVGAAVPMIHSWSHHADPGTLRLFYLPMAALAAIIGCGGVVPALLAVLIFAAPLIEIRSDWANREGRLRSMHEAVISAAADHGSAPMFVAGLPRTSPSGRFAEFALGVDRLVAPPLVAPEATTPVYALRPIDGQVGTRTIPYGDEIGLPFTDGSHSFTFDQTGKIFGRLPVASPPLPDLPATVNAPAVLVADQLAKINAGEVEARIVTPGVRSDFYRVTIFTAGGYITAILPNQAGPDAVDGYIGIRNLLVARYVDYPGADQLHVAWALRIATVLDRSTRFPVLLEAGNVTLDGTRESAFTATHVARTPIHLTLARDFSAFLMGPQ